MAKILTEDQKLAKRTKLIELATRILERDGEAGLTARGLASEAGISRTTPYLYFKDKEAILDGIRLATLQKLIAQFETVTQVEPLAQMRQFGEVYTNFGLEHPQIYKLVFMTDFSQRPMSDELQANLNHFHSMVFSPMERAFDAGLLRIPAARLNLVMWSCIHGLLTLSHTGIIDKQTVLPQLRQDLGQVLSQGFLLKRPKQ